MNILVIGDVILDHYVWGSIERQSPEDVDVPVVDVEREEYRLGGAGNVAANIKSLAVVERKNDPVIFVSLSSVFSKFTGKIIDLHRINSDTSCIVDELRQGELLPSQRELIKTRIVNKKTNKQIVRVDNSKKYSKDDVRFYRECFGNLDSYDVVVVSDYDKGLIDESVIDKLEKFNGLVFVDTKKKDLTIWSNIKNCIVKINHKEFAMSKGSHSVSKLVVTEGSQGSTLHHTPPPTRGRLSTYFPTNPRSGDVVGSGDIYLSALCVHYVKYRDVDAACCFANQVAGLGLDIWGTAVIDSRKVFSLWEQHLNKRCLCYEP